MEGIKTELTEQELIEMYGEVPVEPDELEITPITHEEGEVNE